MIEVPHLRIVDDELWAAVKARQSEVAGQLTDPHTTTPLNDLHRPRSLLSGLLTCGVCGGGYTITAKDRYGCARRGRQGTCSNSRGVQRRELEQRVLNGLGPWHPGGNVANPNCEDGAAVKDAIVLQMRSAVRY